MTCRIAISSIVWGLGVATAGGLAYGAGPNDDGTQLLEIVVTAQRVESTESKTPVSMEVIDGAQLTRNGVVDVQTLTQADPSLNFDTGAGNGWITLRGVSGQGGIGPAVPIAFDGFYYNLAQIFNDSLYDVNRVEVLRGPQGTLFGRNASGGLINVITNDPTKTFGGYGELTLGNYHQIDAEGALNLPVSDKVQLRFAFSSAQHAGYRSLVYGMGEVADDQDAKSGRVKLAVQPIDGLELLASFQRTSVGGAGVADNIFLLPADANNFPTHAYIPLNSHTSQVYNVAFSSQVAVNDELLQLQMTYEGLPLGMTLAYLGGYDRFDYLHTGPLIPADTPLSLGVPNTIELLGTQNPRTQNQELRLTSSPNQAVTWQGGLYYFRSYIGDNSSHFRDSATPGVPDIVSFPYNNTQTSKAGYGQLGWHLGETTLTAGARYTSDYVAQTDKASPDDGVFPAAQSTTYSKTTWHIGEEWNITDHNLLYAKVDTGYRAGAFNLVVPCNCTGGTPQPTTIVPYAPEYVTAYEIGTKNRQLDERLLVNGDVFYMKYNGQQLTESNQGGIFTVNARATNIYGAELQVAAIVNPIGRFDLNATWLHARFDAQEFTNALNQTYNIGGNQLLQSPDISLTAAVEHEFKLTSGSLTARLQTKYQTGQFFDFYNFPDSRQSAYTRSDAHLIYEGADKRWSLDAFVRNIENALVIVDESESFAPPLSQPGTYNVGFQTPRTYGMSLRVHF